MQVRLNRIWMGDEDAVPAWLPEQPLVNKHLELLGVQRLTDADGRLVIWPFSSLKNIFFENFLQSSLV